jgi:hypothetical protein
MQASLLDAPPERVTSTVTGFIRRGALAGLVAAALGLLGDLYHLTSDREEGTVIFKIHGALLISALALAIVALFALALYHSGRAAKLWRIAPWVALFGTVLVAGDIYYETVVTPTLVETAPAYVDGDLAGWHLLAVIISFAIFGLGWMLVGIATAVAGLLSRPGAIVLIVGGLIGFTPLPGSYVLLFIGLALVSNDLRKRVEAG